MKTVLVVSDIHGYKERFEAILEQHSNVDYILSAGDSELSDVFLAAHNVHAVYGNAYKDVGDAHVLLTIEGQTLVMVHGHEHRVHYGDHQLVKLLKKHDAVMVIHGHTHIAKHTKTRHGIIVNPGAVSRSRGRMPASYSVLTIDEYRYTLAWYDAQNHQLLTDVEGHFKEQ